VTLIENVINTVKVRTGTVQGLFKFLIRRKMWWLVPMILFLVVGFIIIILAQSSPIGPFIYTLF